MAVPQFHRLTVREVRPETADAVSVAFDVPAALRDAYRFRAGQFLTLRTTLEGEEVRRSYSICVSEGAWRDRGELRVAIKRVAGGRFSHWAHDSLRAGQTIDVMTPDGRFTTAIDPARRGHYLGVAGGSGITPMLSLIETVLETEPQSRFTLIYGNRGVAAILFLEALEALKNRYLTRLRLMHVLSDETQEIELLSGLLDLPRCRALLATLEGGGRIDEAFICGPAPMMDAAEAALLEFGLPRERIHIERFGTPAPAAVPHQSAIAADAPCAQVRLVLDGKSRTLQLPYDGPSLLDAGLAAGAALPYACKSGVCCTCRARVLEGEVRMDRNDSLDPHEVAAGFVLTCQAHPVSERVVVSYDER